jgi:hypothetical protein
MEFANSDSLGNEAGTPMQSFFFMESSLNPDARFARGQAGSIADAGAASATAPANSSVVGGAQSAHAGVGDASAIFRWAVGPNKLNGCGKELSRESH